MTASTWLKGRPISLNPSIPAKLRIWGFTKMMYDMTTKVVTPAIVSRASVVPFAEKRKRRSRKLSRARGPRRAVSSIAAVSLR